MEGTKRWYVGIDLGKREYTMAVIGRNGKMSVPTGKSSIPGRQAYCMPSWRKRTR